MRGLVLLLWTLLMGSSRAMDDQCHAILVQTGGTQSLSQFYEFLLRYQKVLCWKDTGLDGLVDMGDDLSRVSTLFEQRFLGSSSAVVCSFARNLLRTNGCREEPLRPKRSLQVACSVEIRAADNNMRDGHLTLDEYRAFVTDRYYQDCASTTITPGSLSAGQQEVFRSLSCVSCMESSDSLSTSCCEEENATIWLGLPDRSWISTVCDAIEVEAAIDCGSLASTPTLTQASSDTNLSGFEVESSAVGPIIMCNDRLQEADVREPLDYLTEDEFEALLSGSVGNDCVERHPEQKLIDEFRVLACASCLPEVGNLSCCQPENARVAIGAVHNAMPTQQERVFLSRICTSIVQVDTQCNSGTDFPTRAPTLAPVTPAPVTRAPTQSPVVQPTPSTQLEPLGSPTVAPTTRFTLWPTLPPQSSQAPSTDPSPSPVILLPRITAAPTTPVIPATAAPTIPTAAAAAPRSTSGVRKGVSWVALGLTAILCLVA